MNPRRILNRRNAMLAGLAGAGGVLLSPWIGKKKLPPSYGNILRMADNLTYVAHRTLLPGESMAREYHPRQVTPFPATGTVNPGHPDDPRFSEDYRRLQTGGFAEWRLSVEGLVARPGAYSLADLKRFPARTQVTRHTCEEGWTAIGEWTGVQLSRVLEAAGIQEDARYVTLHTFDDWTDSIDLLDALHPQTLLAYGMNGRDLPVPHGAPVRLRLERQLGYKSWKYLRRIVVTNELDDGGEKGNIRNGWAWYAGI